MPEPFPWERPDSRAATAEPINTRDAHWHRCQRVWAQSRGFEDGAERSSQRFTDLATAVHQQFGDENQEALDAQSYLAEAGRLFGEAYTLVAMAEQRLKALMERL